MKAISAALALLAAGCATTVQPGDGEPPDLVVTDLTRTRQGAYPVVYATEGGPEATRLGCASGRLPDSVAELSPYLIPRGRTRLPLLFSFRDPSGVEMAVVRFDDDVTVVTPDDLPVVAFTSHGLTQQVRQWRYTREAGELRSPVLFFLEIDTPTASPALSPSGLFSIGAEAEDGAGNDRSYLIFFATEAAACL